jgi:IclR family transcriptional regulator, KDG regulon repressor
MGHSPIIWDKIQKIKTLLRVFMPTSDTPQTLHRAIALLDCFTADRPSMGVREAARLLNQSTSTTGRLLAAMKELGILSQNPSTRLYSMGGKVLAWAGVYTSGLDVRNKALPAMEALHKEILETISLYVVEGNERVCVERMESIHSVRMTARIGRRLPLYAGSAGKLFLAFLPEAQTEEIIKSTKMVPLTPYTICEPELLRQELERIREQGYSYSQGEWEVDASGVAAPIFDAAGKVNAALTISGPTQRFTPDMVSQYIREIVRVAYEISQDVGYTGKMVFRQPEP